MADALGKQMRFEQGTPSIRFTRPLQWRDIYEEAELYKAAVRVYTKPLFPVAAFQRRS